LDHLFEVLHKLAQEVENHIRAFNGGLLEGERINYATTARKYADVVKHAFHLLDGDEGPIFWKLRRLNHNLQMATVFADDRVYLADIEDDAFEREELKPGEVTQFIRAHEYAVPLEGPYGDKEKDAVFFEAQRGGWSRDTYGYGDLNDDHDTRVNDGWAEYLEPEGLGEFYASEAWHILLAEQRYAIAESERLVKAGQLRRRWGWVKEYLRQRVEDAFDEAVSIYLDGAMNITAMAVVCHKFVSGTRFSEEEMAALTKLIPAISHVDGTHLGVSLYRWIDWNRTELDEIIEDGGYDLIEPNTDSYEWYLADQWSAHFERQYEQHWTRQAQARTPLQYEWVPNSVVNELRVSGSIVKVRKSDNGQAEIAIWASTFMGKADVAYNMAYFKAVCQELPMLEVLAVAERERQAHRWQPNRVVVSADVRGLVMSDRSFLRWKEAAASVGKLVIPAGRKEGLLDMMRRVYVRANGERQHIAVVGKVIAGL